MENGLPHEHAMDLIRSAVDLAGLTISKNPNTVLSQGLGKERFEEAFKAVHAAYLEISQGPTK